MDFMRRHKGLVLAVVLAVAVALGLGAVVLAGAQPTAWYALDITTNAKTQINKADAKLADTIAEEIKQNEIGEEEAVGMLSGLISSPSAVFTTADDIYTLVVYPNGVAYTAVYDATTGTPAYTFGVVSAELAQQAAQMGEGYLAA